MLIMFCTDHKYYKKSYCQRACLLFGSLVKVTRKSKLTIILVFYKGFIRF